MIKIAFITESFSYGSIGSLLTDIIFYLESTKKFKCYSYYSLGEKIHRNSFCISNIISRNIHAVLSRLTGFQGYFSIISTLLLLNKIKIHKPDIIYLGNIHANYINMPLFFNYAKRNKIHIVFGLHDSWFYTGKCTYYVPADCTKWMNMCYKCPLKYSDKVNPTLFFDASKRCHKGKKRFYNGLNYSSIGVSEWICEEARKSVLMSSSIYCVYNWVNEKYFNQYNINYHISNMKDLSKKNVVLFVASNISIIKGYRELLYLSNKLDDRYQIVLIGRNKRNYKIPSNVKYIRAISNRNELAEYYSAADVCINLTKYETFGMVTAESLACGTPVIVYNNTASKELIDSTCGCVINQNNFKKEIIDSIEYILSKGKKYYSQNCINKVKKNYNRMIQVHKYYSIFIKVKADMS